MNLNEEEFIRLITRYNAGEATKEESDLVDAYYQIFEQNDEVTEHLNPIQKNEIRNEIRERLHASLYPKTHRFVNRSSIIYAAASLALVCLMSYLVARWPFQPAPILEAAAKDRQVKPGKNRAILTLSDNSQIVLENAKEGIIALQGSTRIRKEGSGELIYQAQVGSIATSNKIEVPRGGQYKLILSDGTKVWLNAASSIIFPSFFDSNLRSVEITGEAYFEVSKDKAHPFIVRTTNQEIEVLGTHFNVNAYLDEEQTKTTLLEGSVKVRTRTATKQMSPREEVILVPGQRASLNRLENHFEVRESDLETAVAWKNGYFKFDRQDLGAILRQVARWYDVEVEYTGPVSADEYVGKIKRSAEIEGVLKVLKLSKVNFELRGRKITVVN